MTELLHTYNAVDNLKRVKAQGTRLPLLRGGCLGASYQHDASQFQVSSVLSAHNPCLNGQISALYTSEAIQYPVTLAREPILNRLQCLCQGCRKNTSTSIFVR